MGAPRAESPEAGAVGGHGEDGGAPASSRLAQPEQGCPSVRDGPALALAEGTTAEETAVRLRGRGTQLTHYLVVRRDLPVGVIMAQLAHAAGESFYQFGLRCRRSSVTEQRVSNPTGAGSSLAGGSTFSRQSLLSRLTLLVESVAGQQAMPDDSWRHQWALLACELWGLERDAQRVDGDVSRTTVVVLGSRNRGRLERLERELVEAGVPHVAVREPDAPWCGELMAVGLEPGQKDELYRYVRMFNVLRADDLRAEGEGTDGTGQDVRRERADDGGQAGRDDGRRGRADAAGRA
jgi:hypothetical protein